MADISLACGLRALEITMNTSCAGDLIRMLRSAVNGRLFVGAGTVLTKGDLDRALSAGASFIVSSVFIPELVNECVKRGVPVFSGGFTPGEVCRPGAVRQPWLRYFRPAVYHQSFLETI